jgi:hypothetical protein
VDLGDEYKQIMIQSREQTQELIDSINKKSNHTLKHWIQGTTCYLTQIKNQEVIKEFELIPKFKEQVLEIVAKTNHIPPTLLDFYCRSITEGGLGGNESDFAHIRRLIPNSINKEQNPYHYLCDTALTMFKKNEPLYASSLIFLGDPEYRQMLGISRGDYGEPVTAENIDIYLKNSYEFLLSLTQKITPGLGLDPLQQQARVNDEFIVYRMLLLKQLATLASPNYKEISSEVKIKIKNFIQTIFHQDAKILFDTLANQIFLLNKEVQGSSTYKNNDGFIVTDVELENITQAITLDIIYNSFSFKLIDVLNYYINEFFSNRGQSPALFAYTHSEQELTPQGTKQFVQIISQYCDNTKGFLQASLNNKALTTTNILECYKYTISTQVYKTQIRIVKNLKELCKDQGTNASQQIALLLNAFTMLRDFSKANCYNLKTNSPCHKLLNFISNKIDQSINAKEWINYIDTHEALVYLMDKLPEQIELNPERDYLAGPGFFKPIEVNQTTRLASFPLQSGVGLG